MAKIYNFGMKLYGRHEWVQDSLHELFVDLWKQHQKLSAVTSLKTYLFKAFKYKLQRQYSKEKRCILLRLEYVLRSVDYTMDFHFTIEKEQVKIIYL